MRITGRVAHGTSKQLTDGRGDTPFFRVATIALATKKQRFAPVGLLRRRNNDA